MATDDTTTADTATTGTTGTASATGTAPEKTPPTTTDTADAAPDPAAGGAGPAGGPVPGDPSTEPVATAAQSHVAGRVGPPTIAQDARATAHTPDVVQIEPGAEVDAATPMAGGPVAQDIPDPATFGAGPYGGETPAPAAANVVTQTVPASDDAGEQEPATAASGSPDSPTLPPGGSAPSDPAESST